ncbi:hypothetical protein KAU32_01990 [bacterium]|nr:hypothetical protein [bacterium]
MKLKLFFSLIILLLMLQWSIGLPFNISYIKGYSNIEGETFVNIGISNEFWFNISGWKFVLDTEILYVNHSVETERTNEVGDIDGTFFWIHTECRFNVKLNIRYRISRRFNLNIAIPSLYSYYRYSGAVDDLKWDTIYSVYENLFDAMEYKYYFGLEYKIF